jgi:hypothetical protein
LPDPSILFDMATKSRKRDGKGHVDPFYQRRQRYKAVLEALGLWEAFAAMPRWAQNHFFRMKIADPTVEFDENIPTGPRDRAMRRMVEKAPFAATVEVDGAPMALRDFYGIVLGCSLVVQGTRRTGLSQEILTFMSQAGPRLKDCYEAHQAAASAAMYYAVFAPVLEWSRLDTRIITVRYASKTSALGKIVQWVVVGSAPAQVRPVTFDGAPRSAYRVARPDCTKPEGMEWLSWTGATIGRSDAQTQLPVYAQGHALRNLARRVNLPAAAPYLEAWLFDSLEKPNIVARQGNDLLVEYRIQDHRLGYLIVTPLADMAIVRTFLFLTMEGTPEARKLKRHLKLTRRDVDWLGLSDLAAFTQTDLRQDPVLRPMLEQCGCGHLFEMDAASYAPTPKPLAADMRRYLRLAA